jgi:hypothetical protein
MLAVFSIEPSVNDRIGTLLRKEELVFSRTWPQFVRSVPVAECAVVVLLDLANPAYQNLKRLRRSGSSLTPIVLVTSGLLQNARRLKDVVVEEVVWESEMEAKLRDAVSCARAAGLLSQLRIHIASATHLPPKVREALTYALTRDPPIRGVSELAVVVGQTRGSLWYQWNKAPRTLRPETSLQTVLDWILLLKAVATRSSGKSWKAAASDMSVHSDTLGSIAKKLTGKTLTDLGAMDFRVLFQRFEQVILATISNIPAH